MTIADFGIRSALQFLAATGGSEYEVAVSPRLGQYIADVDAAVPYGEVLAGDGGFGLKA